MGLMRPANSQTGREAWWKPIRRASVREIIPVRDKCRSVISTKVPSRSGQGSLLGEWLPWATPMERKIVATMVRQAARNMVTPGFPTGRVRPLADFRGDAYASAAPDRETNQAEEEMRQPR